MNSSVARNNKKMRYQKYKKYNTIQKNRYFKKEYTHGYFFNWFNNIILSCTL